MIETLIENADSTVPITIVQPKNFIDWVERQPDAVQRWTATTCFNGKAGSLQLLNDGNGKLTRALFVVPDSPVLWDWAPLATKLPIGTYAIDGALPNKQAHDLAIAWGLAQYRFDRYKSDDKYIPSLVAPKNADLTAARRTIRFTNLARDLINTPASDMGPNDLANVATRIHRKLVFR